MKLHRFFSPNMIVEQNSGNEAVAGSTLFYIDESKQFRKVLRFTSGDQVVLFDGSGYDFLCEIKDYQDETVILKVLEKKKNDVLPLHNVSLYAALVKKDTFEWIVQKATELGVSDIIPVIADRSEKKSLNVERLRKIMIEAAEQSGRGTIPVLHDVCTLETVTENHFPLEGGSKDVSRKSAKIAFEPNAVHFTKDIFLSVDSKDSTSLNIDAFIGPEGGWSEQEINAFEKAGVLVRSLGLQVLRTETAVVAALAQLVF